MAENLEESRRNKQIPNNGINYQNGTNHQIQNWKG